MGAVHLLISLPVWTETGSGSLLWGSINFHSGKQTWKQPCAASESTDVCCEAQTSVAVLSLHGEASVHTAGGCMEGASEV